MTSEVRKAGNDANTRRWEIARQYPIDKACPFCGKTMAILERDKINQSLYLVKCRECYAITDRAGSPEKAIELWNDEVFPDYVLTTSRESPYVDDPDIWGDLKNAIVVAVFDEYKKQKKLAMRSWQNFTVSKRHLENAESEKKFFTDPTFVFFSNLSGDSIVDAADKQAKYDVQFREVHQCHGCGNNDCEHKHYIWWLWDKGNEYDVCPGRKKYKLKKEGMKPWIKQQLYRSEPR